MHERNGEEVSRAAAGIIFARARKTSPATRNSGIGFFTEGKTSGNGLIMIVITQQLRHVDVVRVRHHGEERAAAAGLACGFAVAGYVVVVLRKSSFELRADPLLLLSLITVASDLLKLKFIQYLTSCAPVTIILRRDAEKTCRKHAEPV